MDADVADTATDTPFDRNVRDARDSGVDARPPGRDAGPGCSLTPLTARDVDWVGRVGTFTAVNVFWNQLRYGVAWIEGGTALLALADDNGNYPAGAAITLADGVSPTVLDVASSSRGIGFVFARDNGLYAELIDVSGRAIIAGPTEISNLGPFTRATIHWNATLGRWFIAHDLPDDGPGPRVGRVTLNNMFAVIDASTEIGIGNLDDAASAGYATGDAVIRRSANDADLSLDRALIGATAIASSNFNRPGAVLGVFGAADLASFGSTVYYAHGWTAPDSRTSVRFGTFTGESATQAELTAREGDLASFVAVAAAERGALAVWTVDDPPAIRGVFAAPNGDTSDVTEFPGIPMGPTTGLDIATGGCEWVIVQTRRTDSRPSADLELHMIVLE